MGSGANMVADSDFGVSLEMLPAVDVANYFLATVDDDAGDSVSNLKLQKLLYYAQGLHLALYGTRMFPEEIVAWTHGPVVPDVYHRFKQYGSGPIPAPEIDLSRYGARIREVLEEVSAVYGQFSASKLRNMTHEEAPWKHTPEGQLIPAHLMESFFKTQLA